MCSDGIEMYQNVEFSLSEFLLSKPDICFIIFFDVVFTVAVVKVVVMWPLVLPAIDNESTHK